MKIRARRLQEEIEREHPGLVREVDEMVRPMVEAIDVRDLARHNAGYLPYGADPYEHLVQQEKARFLHAIQAITAAGGPRTVCDLGTFIPYLPVALAKLGYTVRIVEKFDVYGASVVNALQRIAADTGIEVYDLDILADPFDTLPQSDVVLLMAVVEHLNGSPRELMQKVLGLLSPRGTLLFEVPNIAEFTKRVRLLAGDSPLGPYGSYLQSAYPYMGHNREMTVGEVRQLLESTGFAVDTLRCYDYSGNGPRSLGGMVAYAAKALAPVRDKGEVIYATARRGA
jgi:SAM-dependent methyltransferase